MKIRMYKYTSKITSFGKQIETNTYTLKPKDKTRPYMALLSTSF